MDEVEPRELRDESDRLLETIDRMRDLERQKRDEEISTPEFHRLANEIVARSREVFEIAAEEERMGDASPRRDTTIGESEPPDGVAPTGAGEA